MRPPPGAAAAPPPPPAPARAATGAGGFWWRFPGADCDGAQYDLGRSCDGADVGACEAACAALPGCAGFNTHGVMKNASCGPAGSVLPGAGCGGCVDLYLLRAAPEPPAGTLTGVAVCLGSGDDALGPGTDESYTLRAPNDGVGALAAPTMFGALHGLETLAQLLDIYGVSPAARVIAQAPILVDDAPRFEYRGLLIDSARHFLPVAAIKRTVDALAYSKLNLLHWHIVDSSAFPCGSRVYPQLAAKGAYDPSAVYSVEDLADVVAYAKARGVRVLPEWDVPGHGKWGAGIPEIMGCADVLDPTIDETYTVLANFLGEMGTIFTDPYLFLGGDEVDASCWDRNPSIAAWLAAHNMTSSQLQQYFWEQMALRVLPSLNKTIGVWEADNVQIDLSSLPAGAFVNVYQSLDTANKTVVGGKTTVVSLAGDWWYLDQNGCGSYHQDGWQCTYDVEPTIATWTPAQAALMRGGETAMWGEGINKDNQAQYVWRGAAAAAERLWSPRDATPGHAAAAARFAEHLCRLALLGVAAGPIGPNFCPADAAPPPAARGADGGGRARVRRRIT